MKTAVACLLVMLALGRAPTMAQAVSDPMDRLRACSTLSKAERMECLDSLSRAIGQESWMISETTSPIDYSPVVVATATASGAQGSPGVKLSITCRGGTTSLVLGGPGAATEGGGYTVTYRIDGGPPKTLAAVSVSSGRGVAIVGDVIGLLEALPPQGEIAFRVTDRRRLAMEGRFALAGLKITRERMAISCKWPSK